MSNCVYALEPVDTLWRDLSPLVELHYAELFPSVMGNLKLARERYEQMGRAGFLRCYTMRVHGVMVGYCSMLVMDHHHTGQLNATEDAVYILPTSRGHGQEFMKWVDDQLADEGVRAVYRTTRAVRDHGALLCRMGYTLSETTYERRLAHIPQPQSLHSEGLPV